MKRLITAVILLFLLEGCAAKDETVFGIADSSSVNIESEVLDETESCSSEYEPADIFVYVCGSVNSPGVYKLKEGSRVYEAIEAAGGLTGDADAELVNQAGFLSDGQQIRIYSKEETANASDNIQGAYEDTAQKVNINTADKAKLTTLPGIGESRAQDIIKYREEHGSFSSIEDIKNVTGIKDKLFEKIKDYIEI